MKAKPEDPRNLMVPEDVLREWQEFVNILAEVMAIPAGLIMRIVDEDIEVFLSSQTGGNPYKPGSKEHMQDSGLYCETVIKTKERLHIPDALADPDWKNNPDVKLNMISYLGFPILFPNGTPFGTICVLDSKAHQFSTTHQRLLGKFRVMVERQLELLYVNSELGEENKRLSDYLSEIQSLRGLIPICSYCKKIRDDKGFWKSVEQYLSRHPKADFTHSICDECMQQHFGELIRKDK